MGGSNSWEGADYTAFPSDFLEAMDAAALMREGKLEGGEIRFRCPVDDHEDRHPSARWNSSKAVWRCDACGTSGGALNLAERLGVQAPSRRRPQNEQRTKGVRGRIPSRDGATVQRAHRQRVQEKESHLQATEHGGTELTGCTLAAYAAAKGLPMDALRAFGLTEINYSGAPAVRMPYPDTAGDLAAVRYRVSLEKVQGRQRFVWKSGTKPCLYGRDRLAAARERNYITLVEGESDCHTLWLHDEPAAGIPGASNWNETRDAPELAGIDRIYVVVEHDQGGEALRERLSGSVIRDRVYVVDLGEYKDPSAVYLADPRRFPERWQAALAAAVPLSAVSAEETRVASDAAWGLCAALAQEPDILAVVAETLAKAGVAGEWRLLKLVYLIVVSRFLDRPVSAAIKGPSSGGKSFALERVLDLFPGDAYHALSAMSDRALAYGEEPLAHRFLVIYEAAGITGDLPSYLIRSLLSEGRIRYETVEKTKDGMRPRLIEREGPTGLLVTTTAVQLHPENETRLLSIPVTDTPEQTRAVFEALAAGTGHSCDCTPWHALQVWLSGAEHRVDIPFASTLVALIPPIAVRLRRDVGTLLALIRTHALLHQASRDRDAEGRIVATVEDYAAVQGLVSDLIAAGVEATVPTAVRETVEAVERVIADALSRGAWRDDDVGYYGPTCSLADVATALRLDKSAASRRVKEAVGRGYLKDLETERGRPKRLVLSEPMPQDVSILPAPEALKDRCTVDGPRAQEGSPPPSTSRASSLKASGLDLPPVHGMSNQGRCIVCGANLPLGLGYACPGCRLPWSPN